MKKLLLLIFFIVFIGFNLAAQKAKLKRIGHTNGINSVLFSPDGRKVVTTSDDHTAKIWDVGTGRVFAELIGHKNRVTNAFFAPDSKKIITVSDDNTAKIWDAKTGRLLINLKDIEGIIESASFSTDGKKIEIYSMPLITNMYFYKIWDAQTGKNLPEPKEIPLLKREKITRLKQYTQILSPDGKIILKIQYESELLGNGWAKMYNAKTGTLINGNLGGNKEVYRAGFSPDGKKIIITSGDVAANIFNGHTGALFVKLKSRTRINEFSFSSDGKKILTENIGGDTVTVWAAQTGAILANIIGNELKASFSPNGRKIVTNGLDKRPKIWDAQTGALLVDIKEYSTEHFREDDISFSADSKKIVVIYNQTVKIWDATTGKLLINLEIDTGDDSWDVSFSPDQKKMVTLGDKTAIIWDVQTGEPLVDLEKNAHKHK